MQPSIWPLFSIDKFTKLPHGKKYKNHIWPNIIDEYENLHIKQTTKT